jgi:hypothetical protein
MNQTLLGSLTISLAYWVTFRNMSDRAGAIGQNKSVHG